ncbi:MAG: hypothetical protein E6R08_02860 [Nevskiaceae bacterium]|nr:MAG: hypothetical protein E6R08_02860 [Nevskiaceae bacterium]
MDCESPAHAIFLTNQKRRYVHDGAEFYILCPGSIYFVCPVCMLDWSDICGNYLDEQDITNRGIANILSR